jgi:hypothetical protein
LGWAIWVGPRGSSSRPPNIVKKKNKGSGRRIRVVIAVTEEAIDLWLVVFQEK